MKKILLFIFLTCAFLLPLRGKAAVIKILEVNFKNKESDWIKIGAAHNNNEPVNLKGFQFEDDKAFKTIEKDFMLAPGKEAKLYFKQEKEDDSENLILYTTYKGLTATTEQIIVKDSNEAVIDAVCWSSGKDTEKEIKDLSKLYEIGAWNSKESKDCFSSKEIGINQSILRKASEVDTNSKADWTIVPLLKKEKNQKDTPKKKTYQNGDLSKDIIINEILPAPSKENGEEWIELYNQANTDIALGNWLLDDDEKGSKPFIIPDHYVIKAKSFLVFSAKETKLSLGNSKDKVKISDYKGQIIDKISYKNAQKDKSYTRIFIQENGKNNEEWFWLDKKSPNQTNPQYKKLKGIIAKNATFAKDYSFLLKGLDHETYQIIFDEEVISGPLAKATFIENATIQILVENINSQRWQLRKYEVLSMPQKKEANTLLNLLIALGISLGIPLIFLMKALYQKIKKPIVK